MSEKMTTIKLPGSDWTGFADWGEKTVDEMYRQARSHAFRELEIANAILGATREDFRVRVVRGIIIQHPIKTLQEGRRP